MQLSVSEKYRLYESSVQNHEADIDFLNKHYLRIFGEKPYTLREDFGGTALMACNWVKQGGNYSAKSIDLDDEPINYGKENHYSDLSDQEKNRIEYIKGNVLDDYTFKSDITVAFNFSYFIFKKRSELLAYFKQVRAGLGDKGAFFLDLFGGTEARDAMVEETEHDDYSYFWDCERYNPITSEVLYYIHFKTGDGVKHRKVFTYDWRMWNMAELSDILHDAGFTNVETFWEGEDDDGSGDGNFYVSSDAENCESWVTYLVAYN